MSPGLVSRVTDAVLDEVREWQGRALDQMHPIVVFDALRVKIRDAGSRRVRNRAVYVAPGVSRDGVREVRGDEDQKTVWGTVFPRNGSPGVGGVTKQSSGLFCPTTAPGSGSR